MKDLFISSDGRPCIEPLLVALGVLLDTFVGKNGFVTFFGWWLFLCVIIHVPGLAYGALLMKLKCLTRTMKVLPNWYITSFLIKHLCFFLVTLFFSTTGGDGYEF